MWPIRMAATPQSDDQVNLRLVQCMSAENQSYVLLIPHQQNVALPAADQISQ